MLCPECGKPMAPIYRSLQEMGIGSLSCDSGNDKEYLDLWYCHDCRIAEEEQSAFTMTKDEVKVRREMLHE